MKVYIVMANSWNGEYDVKTVDKVYTSEEAAAAYVEEKNHYAMTMGPYATTYEYEEYETE